MSTTTATTDVVNAILGVGDESPIASLRNQKPELAKQLQDYYLALFEPDPESVAAFPLTDRYLVAVRVASHTGSRDVVTWYANLAREAGVPDELLSRVESTGVAWTEETPFGAAVRHTDRVTKEPAQSEAAHLQLLKDAGYTPAGILSLAQTIAFVNYQLRLIAGLRAFGETK
jgi:uncharacterized protein YciW